jgi:polyphosphate kinase
MTIAPDIDLKDPSLYINREMSLLAFNERVLDEAMNSHHPLLERVKFIAIFASNMDEFFMVRVSGLKQLVMSGVAERAFDGRTPREQLALVHGAVSRLTEKMTGYWEALQAELAANAIEIVDYNALGSGRRRKLNDYFEEEIFPTLTPLALDPSHPFPHISNLSLNLAVIVQDPDTGVTRYARLKVPAQLPRLVPLRRIAPEELLLPTEQKYVWVEQLIKVNLGRLFPGMDVVDAWPFRVTRNTDMEIQEEEADDLLDCIEENLRQRHFGTPTRIEIDHTMPPHVQQMLMKNLGLSAYEIYRFNGPLSLVSLWELHKAERPELKDDPLRSRHPEVLRSGENIFELIKQRDILFHRPYDNFSDVIGFFSQAAEDPAVLAIKMTLYRVGPNPAIVNALMKARENGKQVTVLVELKARFDEESNIGWARALENAGVHVVYGVIGLKTHAKVSLVVRREGERLRRYLHLATGNYNIITSRIYTDLDLLTADPDMGADASELFNFLTGFSKQREYRKFLVSPVTARQGLMEAIEREIAYGPEGRIVLKCNAVIDEKLIRALYRASQAGVRVDMIVRGMCSLRPGLPGISETIRVKSIVGRFLEHARIYYFRNGGDPLLYSGSADLMPRNLDRRVEVLFPVLDPVLQTEIIDNILEVQLTDTRQGHWLQADGSYVRASADLPPDQPLFSSQEWFLYHRHDIARPPTEEAAPANEEPVAPARNRSKSTPAPTRKPKADPDTPTI